MQWKKTVAASLVACAVVLTGCSSTTTISPSGKAPVFESRTDQTVTIDPANLDQELENQVGPLLAATGGRDRVIVVSYTLTPSGDTLQRIMDYVMASAGRTDVIKVERDFLAHAGVSITVRDVKQSNYPWYSTQAVSDNYGHATSRNLAQQAANPNDLDHPQEIGDPNPQAALGAVDRYQRGSVRPFGNVSMEAGGGKSQ